METRTRIIGPHSLLPQSGKSTIANHLAAKYCGRVYSIATAIWQEAIDRGMPFAAHASAEYKDRPDSSLHGLSPRQVLIGIDEGFTGQHGRSYWINLLLKQIRAKSPYLAIIDDVRRLEEGFSALRPARSPTLTAGCLARPSRTTARSTKPSSMWREPAASTDLRTSTVV